MSNLSMSEKAFIAALAYTGEITRKRARETIQRYVNLLDASYKEVEALILLDEHLRERGKL